MEQRQQTRNGRISWPYSNLSNAINAAASNQCILLYPGTYSAAVTVTRPQSIGAPHGAARLGPLAVNAPLHITGPLTFTSGLTCGNAINFGPSWRHDGQMIFDGTQTLGGPARSSSAIRSTRHRQPQRHAHHRRSNAWQAIYSRQVWGYRLRLGPGHRWLRLVNRGTIEADAAGGAIYLGTISPHTWRNDGWIAARNGGTIYAYDAGQTLQNFISGTLTGGNYAASNGGTFLLEDVDIVVNNAEITLDGPDSAIVRDSNGTSALTGLQQNGGSLNIATGILSL